MIIFLKAQRYGFFYSFGFETFKNEALLQE